MTGVSTDCRGFCRDCGREHVLPAAAAVPHALNLMRELQAWRNVGLGLADDPRLDLAHLDGPGRGQMFGVLTGVDPDGRECVLRAFSGQFNGVWEVPGWVPPIIDPGAFAQVCAPDEARIKALTRRLDETGPDWPGRKALLDERRALSRDLMGRIFALYRLRNFRGRSLAMSEAFLGSGMPTGTGECCAPKLLHHAARHGIVPLGMAEFFMGRENRSGTRLPGRFYAPCAEKCRPILGFLLCGLDEARGRVVRRPDGPGGIR